MLRYKCLAFDHDDTVVDSSRNVHYPSYVEFMKIHRPDKIVTLEEYIRYNFTPGVAAFFRDICGLTEEELEEEHDFWVEYTKDHVSEAFPGIKEIMERQKKEGGYIAVISHSYVHNIQKDFAHNNLPVPDAIWGWSQDPTKRKPSPYPMEEVMKELYLKRDEILVIDDLKPGLDMTRATGVSFAAAGWSYQIEENVSYMKSHADYYLKSIQELEAICFR